MKAFAELYTELDATTSSNAKLAAMQAYFAQPNRTTPRGRCTFSPVAGPGNWCR